MLNSLARDTDIGGRMGLLNRYRTIKRGQRAQKEKESESVDLSELDDFDLDAGDALEAEIAAKLAEQKKQIRRPKG